MKKKTKQQTVQKWLDIAVIGSYLLLIVLHLLDGQWPVSLWIGIATLWVLFATWMERRADRLGDNAREATEHWRETLGVMVALNEERQRLEARCEGLVRAVRRAVWAVKAVREIRKIVNDDTLCADAMVANIGEVVK